MKTLGLVFVSVAAATVLVWQAPARADSAAASCQLRQKGSGRAIEAPCTFSQRQGYIDVTLQGGGTYSFSPGNRSGQYTDGKGESVDRTLLVGDTQEFRWRDGRSLTVRYQREAPAGGGAASGGIAVEDMARNCAGEASAKFKVSPRDIKTEKPKQTQGMWEVWGQYPASPSPQVFICSYNAERQFLSADKYQP